MKEKVMLIVPMLHQGGFERVCVTTARLLEPYYDVTIVLFNSANMAYDVKGLKLIDLQLGVQKGKLCKIINMLRRSRRVRKLKKELQPKVAYSFGPTANLVNALSRTGKTKVWLGLRNYTDVEEKNKIRLFARKADLMICCSRTIEKVLHERFRFQKTTTLYNLYDVEQIRADAASAEPELPWQDENARYLISMGRDDDMKGFWHMLKVFACVHRQVPDTRLVLLGAGSFAYYRKLAEDLGIQEAVYFAGMQTEPYKYLKKGSVYLLTSSNEGFPNALVEGMALGLAPVSTDCMTGPAEILVKNYDETAFDQLEREGSKKVIWGDYGLLVPEMSHERNLNAEDISEEENNMAEAVVTLLEDEELLAHYQKAAISRAQCFTYDSYMKQLLKLLENGEKKACEK